MKINTIIYKYPGWTLSTSLDLLSLYTVPWSVSSTFRFFPFTSIPFTSTTQVLPSRFISSDVIEKSMQAVQSPGL